MMRLAPIIQTEYRKKSFQIKLGIYFIISLLHSVFFSKNSLFIDKINLVIKKKL
jgi:hypothetical protein